MNLSVGKGISYLPLSFHIWKTREISIPLFLFMKVFKESCEIVKKKRRNTTNRCVINIKYNIWSQVTNTFREESTVKKNVTRFKVIHGCGLFGEHSLLCQAVRGKHCRMVSNTDGKSAQIRKTPNHHVTLASWHLALESVQQALGSVGFLRARLLVPASSPR